MKYEKSIILFGAGHYGRRALAYFGRESVYGFADNNPALAGTAIDGLPVLSFEQLKSVHSRYEIVIAAGAEILFSIAAQLEEAGIDDYKVFLRILAEEQNFPDSVEPVYSGREVPGANSPSGQRHVLMAAYLFPPVGGSGVFRSIKFAKYLPEFGWQPTVISTDRPPLEMNYTDESLVCEIPKGTEVIRIPDRIGTMRKVSFSPQEEKTLLKFVGDVLWTDEKAGALYQTVAQTRAGRAMLMTFPCYSLLWAWEALQFIEEHMDMSEFQMIYTTSMPYSTHLIGYYLKKKYGIPWVADYRDPWTQSEYFYENKADIRYKLLHELESILLKAADRNLWVEENTAKAHSAHFGLSQNQVASITNGYDEADYAGLQASTEQPEKFTIVYCGVATLPARIAGLRACFSALQQLVDERELDSDSIRFRFVGDAGQDVTELAKPYGLEGIIRQSGYCKHEEALQVDLDASLLLLIVGDEPKQKYVHGGKFFDYLRSGRPILALAPPDGAVAQTLRETGHGEAYLSTDQPGVKAMILREYQKWQRGEKRELLHSPRIERFERKQLTKQLADIFDEVC